MWYYMHTMKESDNRSTNIRIKQKTKTDLASLGFYGESFDDIVQRLISVFRTTSELVAQLPKRG
jgi:hypothetical protein